MPAIQTLEELRIRIPESNTPTDKKILDRLDDQAAAFIKASPFLLFATADREGLPEVSPKGDEPGFVHIENDTTLLYPERDGNKLAFGLQNILVNPHVSLIFMLPGTGETLRVGGRATILNDPELLERLSARGKPAVLAVRIDLQRVFFHCARSILRAQLWKPESWPEKRKISFGKIIAPKIGQGETVANQIDAFVEDGYRTGL